MPKVGDKHFAYTDAGVNAARVEAGKTGGRDEFGYGKGKGNELSGNKPRKTSAQRRKAYA